MYIHVHVMYMYSCGIIKPSRTQTVICLLVICFIINMLRWCWCSAHQYDPDAACFCSSHKIYALLRPINSTSHTHSLVFVFALYPPISLLLVRWTDNYASDSRLQRRKQGLETVTEKKDLINFSDVHVSCLLLLQTHSRRGSVRTRHSVCLCQCDVTSPFQSVLMLPIGRIRGLIDISWD